MTQVEPTQPTIRILQDALRKQFSGVLTFADQRLAGMYWRVYLGSGNIHYATCSSRWPERLMALATQLLPNQELPPTHSQQQSDYEYLCRLWQDGILSLQSLRQILFCLSQEAVIHSMTIPDCKCQLERSISVDPILISVNAQSLLGPVKTRIQQWLQLRDHISSPFVRFSTASPEALRGQLAQASPSDAWGEALLWAISQQQSLYQIAQRLRSDPLTIAQTLLPLIQAHQLTCLSTSQLTRPLIACIDDSNAVQRKVRLTLEAAGYEVVGVIEPARALTTFVRLKPKLILMDITMPEINGYDLCKMLKQTGVLKDVPVIMLTGRDGIIDRLRAKVVGSEDYITKPFDAQTLIEVIEKYLPTAKPSEATL